jgi:hypothetical protein
MVRGGGWSSTGRTCRRWAYELQTLDGLRDSAGQPVTVEELVTESPRDGYAVAVGVSVEYFRD